MRSDEETRLMLSQVLGKHGLKNFRFLPERTAVVGGRDVAAISSFGRLRFRVRRVRPLSIAEVLGILAIGVLESQQTAGSDVLVPLLIVEHLGDKTRKAVRQFMSRHAPACGWGLIDRSGVTQLVIPALALDIDRAGEMPSSSWPRQRPVRLFSDLNQWMLKVLLLAEAPASLWGGPRQRVATPTALHRAANVSVEKAHQFFRAFEQAGLIRQTRQGLVVVRKRELLDMWFHEQRSRSPLRMPVRWIFGAPASLEQVFCKEGMTADFAVCGFEACRSLGLLHTPVTNREVYVLDPEAALAAWDLEACDDRDAHFHLWKARSPQTILRGRVVKDRLPVVDVLQAALDVCDQPPRGAEQAEYITTHVLGWSDNK